nr:immunoglobulin light chain junction region [Macaca mulatta]
EYCCWLYYSGVQGLF